MQHQRRIEGQTNKRNERSDKKKRIYPYLSRDAYSRLDKIRQAVNSQRAISIHDLAEDFIEVCVTMPEFIEWIQDKYRVPKDHPMRVIRVTTNGQSSLLHLYEA